MSKLSAGIVVYRKNSTNGFQLLLVHPGGPFWKNKEEGAWSIPKGEYEEGEDPLKAAKREFTEETGNILPEGNFIQLAPVKTTSGKVISAWAIEADFEPCFIQSNYFEMEWPPRSGKKQSFAEVDKAAWFTIDEAALKMNKGQLPFLQEITLLKERF